MLFSSGTPQRKPAAHPIAHLIASLPQTSRLSPYHFTRLINARENHFLNPSFTSLQDLAEYSAGTQASLLYLLLQASDPPLPAGGTGGMILPHSRPFEHVGDEHLGHEGTPEGGGKVPDSLLLDHAASHLAVAMTISILLRSIPHHAAKRINVIPTEIGESPSPFDLSTNLTVGSQRLDTTSRRSRCSGKDLRRPGCGRASLRSLGSPRRSCGRLEPVSTARQESLPLPSPSFSPRYASAPSLPRPPLISTE